MESYATAQQVYAAGLIFARVGALLMLIPGIGEQMVPPRIRLSFGLLMTLMLYPVLAGAMPALPGTVGGLAAGVIKELLIGLMIGAILRMFLSSLATAGEMTVWQYAVRKDQNGTLQQAPLRRIAIFRNDTLRIEPYASPLPVVGPK